MKNKGTLHRDNFSVSLQAVIYIPPVLKGILVGFFGAMVAFAIFILSLFSGEESRQILLPLCGLVVLLFFVGRYVSWNLFGRETIVITTKSISYSRSYGLFHTPERVILFRYLATRTEVVGQQEDIEFGLLHFYDRVETTLQLKPIFNTGINLPATLLLELEEQIHLLFKTDKLNPGSWLPYSQN